MNTVEKGDAFEDRVHAIFTTLLNTGELGLDHNRTEVHRKKKYYSKSQEAYITFDLSLELYMPKAVEPSFIILIECKDYKTPIDVHKIRNFKGQIEEIGGHKGYFVTSSKFQQGAINLAETSGIALITMNINDDISWIARRTSPKKLSLSEEYDIPFLATIDNKIFTNIIDFLSYENFKVNYNYSVLKIGYLSELMIQEKVLESILGCSFSDRIKLAYFSKEALKPYLDRPEINFLGIFKLQSSEIIGILNEKYNINVVDKYSLSDNELGRLNISNRTIYLSQNLDQESPRWRFTLAHEFGHVVLHEELLKENNVYILSDKDNLDDPFLKYSKISIPASLKRMEIQANIFACNLLMPIVPLTVEFVKSKKNIGISQSYIRLDDQSVNIRNYNILINMISEQFGVSREAVRHKLYELKFIKDFSRTQLLKSSIDELKASL